MLLMSQFLPPPWVLLLTPASLLAASILYQCFFSPLAKIPGPFLAKWTDLYRAYITTRGDYHRDVIRQHKKYGHLVRMGPNYVSVTDPWAFRQIYKAGNKFNKSAPYNIMKGARTFDLTGQTDEKIHSAQRRLVSRAYSMDSMVHLEPNMNSVISDTINQLESRSSREGGEDGEGYIDLGLWLQLFAFDIIGSISFSRPFNYIQSGTDFGMFRRIQSAMASLGLILVIPWILSLQMRLQPLVGTFLAAADRNGYFFDFSSKEVASRRDRLSSSSGDDQEEEEGKEGKDIVSQLFDTQAATTTTTTKDSSSDGGKEERKLTDLDISYMMTSNVFAGSDTTSNALRAVFYLLLTHPDCYRKLMDELVQKKEEGKLMMMSGEEAKKGQKGAVVKVVSFREAEECEYLQAVMYEALRLYPSAGGSLDRDVPAGGLTVGKQFLPEGTVVGTSAWAIHRVPEIWGEDCEEFRPERWLDERTVGHLKRYFFSFGGGSRTCIGRNISWMEMSKLIPTLMMHFNMQLAEGAELKETFGMVVFLSGLKVRLTKRQSTLV